MFVLFHKRVCGPLANTLFQRRMFGFAIWALNAQGQAVLAIGCGVAVIVHHALSYERLVWLVGS